MLNQILFSRVVFVLGSWVVSKIANPRAVGTLLSRRCLWGGGMEKNQERLDFVLLFH
jgi:hypothetical protein